MIAHFSDSDVIFYSSSKSLVYSLPELITLSLYIFPSEGDLQTMRMKGSEAEEEILDLFSIAMEFNLAYKKDSFRIPFCYYF
jgi:hypothetical protein